MSSTPSTGPGDSWHPPAPEPAQPSSPDPRGYLGNEGPPVHPGQPHQAPLSTIAILGLVFAVVFWPAGLVLSIIGIVQTKAGRRRGRGLAIAGVVVSAVLALIGTVVATSVIASLGRTTGSAISARSPAVTASPSVPAPAPSASTSDGQQGVGPFGQTADFQGLAVTVAPPQPFTPSDTAAGGNETQSASFDVTLANHRQTPVDPSTFYATVSSGGHESTPIFDSEQDIGGQPSTPVLPGDSVTFRVAFGVADPGSITMQVRPDFDSPPTIFTNRS